MSSLFTGVWVLVRLALRRDRIKLPVWLVSIGGMVAITAVSVTGIYDTSPERLSYASTSAASAIARAFNGPITGADSGSIALAESFTFMSIFVALMNTLLVIRHTRQNEETNRAELIGAAPTGRYALLISSMIVALGANVLLAVLATVGYMAGGLEWSGSLLAGLSMGTIGLAFAGIGAIAAQVMATARGAAGVAGVAIGGFFLLRAAGDVFGIVQANGLVVSSSWPSWLSPIGLARESRPFTDANWWILGLMILLCVSFISVALLLNRRRDFGVGLIGVNGGSANASPLLSSPIGLAWRLQRGLWYGYAVGLAVLTLAFGAFGGEVETFAQDNPDMSSIIQQLGGSQSLVDAYNAFLTGLLAMVAAAYGIQATLRLRSEETQGYLELILAAPVRRSSWLISHSLVAVIGAIGLLIICGVCFAISLVLTDNRLGLQLQAALVQLPAILVCTGVAVAAFGILSRAVAAVAWGAFTISLLASYFADLLKLPGWAVNLSPFTHIPLLPLEDFTIMPLVTLTLIAVGLYVLGSVSFARRDVTN